MLVMDPMPPRGTQYWNALADEYNSLYDGDISITTADFNGLIMESMMNKMSCIQSTKINAKGEEECTPKYDGFQFMSTMVGMALADGHNPFKDLTPWILGDPELNLPDVYAVVKEELMQSDGKYIFVPQDANLMMTVYRTDFVDPHNKTQFPDGWSYEAVVKWALENNGTDFDNDGVGDHALCMPEDDGQRGVTNQYAYAAALQIRGSKQGTFFHEENYNMKVNVDNPAFRRALETMAKLYGTFVRNYDMFWNSQQFAKGKCGMLLFENDRTLDTIMDPMAITGITNKARYNVGFARLPGVRYVWDRYNNVEIDCKTQREKCPYADDDGLNYVTGLSFGGLFAAVTDKSPKALQAYRFWSWSSRTTQSRALVYDGPAHEPYRRSHFNDASRAWLLQRSKTPFNATSGECMHESCTALDMSFQMLKSLYKEALDHGNAALDMRLPGAMDGFYFHLGKMQTNVADKIMTVDEAISDYIAKANDKVIESGGATNMFVLWRKHLNLPVLCSPGFILDSQRASCIPCANGTIDARLEIFDPGVCAACPAGFACPKADESPIPCQAGSATQQGAVECHICAAGTMTPNPRMPECQKCTPGFHQPERNKSVCLPCPVGTFQTMAGSSNCTPCGGDLTTQALGSTSFSECMCPRGTYSQDPASKECPSCPPAMDCEGFGAPPLASFGHMVTASDPLRAYKCKPPEHCPGGGPDVCTGGRAGVACGGCPSGETLDNGICSKCASTDAWPMYLFFALCVMSIGITYYLLNKPFSSKATNLGGLAMGLGMLVTNVQVYGVFDQLVIDWPEDFQEILESFTFITLDLGQFGMDCSITTTVSKYITRTVFFASCLFIILSLHLISQLIPRTALKWQLEFTCNLMGAFLQMVFVMMTSVAMIPMACYDHPNGATSVVKAPDIVCGSADHTLMLTFGVLLLTIPFAFYSECIRASIVVPGKRNMKVFHFFLNSHRFLFVRFRVDVYYWGCLLGLRSLLLSLASAVFPNDGHAQAIFLITFFMLMLSAHMFFWPWKIPLLNLLEMIIIACNLLILAVASAEKAYSGILLLILFLLSYGTVFVILCMSFTAIFYKGPMGSPSDVFNLTRPPKPDDLAKDITRVSASLAPLDNEDVGGVLATMQIYDLLELKKSWDIMAMVVGDAGGIVQRKSFTSSNSTPTLRSRRSFTAEEVTKEPKQTVPEEKEEDEEANKQSEEIKKTKDVLV